MTGSGWFSPFTGPGILCHGANSPTRRLLLWVRTCLRLLCPNVYAPNGTNTIRTVQSSSCRLSMRSYCPLSSDLAGWGTNTRYSHGYAVCAPHLEGFFIELVIPIPSAAGYDPFPIPTLVRCGIFKLTAQNARSAAADIKLSGFVLYSDFPRQLDLFFLSFLSCPFTALIRP